MINEIHEEKEKVNNQCIEVMVWCNKSKSIHFQAQDEEKLKVAGLGTEANIKKKKRDAGYQFHALKVKEKLAQAQARAKVLEDDRKVHNIMVHRSQGMPYKRKDWKV